MSKSEEYISSYKELLGTQAGSELAELIEQQLAEIWEDMAPQEQIHVMAWMFGHA